MSLRIEPIELKNQKKHPRVKRPDVMMQHEFSTLIVAPKGSGKTNLICNLLLNHYKGYFHKIVVCSPTVDNDNKWLVVKRKKHLIVENRKKGKLMDCDMPTPAKDVPKVVTDNQHESSNEFDGIIPKEDFIGKLDDLIPMLEGLRADMDDIRAKLEAQHREDDVKMFADRVLVVIDDQAGLFSGGINNNPQINFVIRHRHYNTSLIIVTQAYKAIPKSIRTNCNSLICFEIPNHKELEVIYEEWPENMTWDQWESAYEQATAEPYSFLYLNNHFPKGRRAFVRFEKRILVK